MNSFTTPLIVFVALQLVLAATLPQISFSLILTAPPSLGDIVQQQGAGTPEDEQEQNEGTESEKHGKLLSSKVVKGIEDSSTDPADSGLVDSVEEILSSTKEHTSVNKPDSSPDNSHVDTGNTDSDDGTVVEGLLADVADGKVLSEPADALNENSDSVMGDIELVREDKKLQSIIDSVEAPEDILESYGDLASLTDGLEDTVSDLEERISDTDVVESLAPAVASSVKEVQESAAGIVGIEDQEITDEILREAKDLLRETGEQIDNTIIEETYLPDDIAVPSVEDAVDSVSVDKVAEELAIEVMMDKVLGNNTGLAGEVQSVMDEFIGEAITSTDADISDLVQDAENDLEDLADDLEAESLSTQLREMTSSDGLKSSTNSAAEPDETRTYADITQHDPVSSISSAGSRVKEITLKEEKYHEVKIISNPEFTQEEEQYIIEEALDAEGLQEWSNGGWQVVGMDFIGITEPEPKWEKAIVYLHLPSGAGNPPVDCQLGWQAVIDVSLDIGKVSDSGLPTLASHECSSAILLQSPAEEGASKSLSISGTRPSFIMAETDDVVSNHIHGTAAYLNTPSVNSSIFENMDSYVAFLLNQKWSTTPTEHMTQIGWLISSIDGCIDCGSQQIPRNSTTLVFADSSVFANLEAHSIPLFEWETDGELVAGTWCNEESKYTIWAQYGDRIFNHNTNISCDNPDNDSKVSNSIFLENWNSADPPSWTDHIGTVAAHSAVTFRADETAQGTSLYSWEHSTNEEQDCTGVRQSMATVQGDLTSGKAAKWTILNDILPAC